MAWKSRIGRLPPANFYAQIMTYLAQAYPDAAITQDTMLVLKPTWDDLWQDGRSADVVAKTTCSCDGKSITLSPAVGLAKLPRGAHRAPAGTERGQLFDPSRMRESPEAERTKRQALMLESQIGRISQATVRLKAKADRARSDSAKAPLLAELKRRSAELEIKRAEAAKIAQKLSEVRRLLGAVRVELAEEEAPAKAAASVEKVAKATKTPEAEKPKRTKASKQTTPTASAADKDAAILAAIQAALPAVAERLAEKMKKAG